MKVFYFLCLLTFICGQTHSSIPFLTHSVSAERSAQAGASGSFGTNFSFEFNPAFLNDARLMLNQQSWADGIRFYGAAGSFKLGMLSVGLFTKYHSVDGIELRGETPSIENKGEFSNYTAITGISVSLQVMEKLTLGTTYKYSKDKLWVYERNVSLYDLGFLYQFSNNFAVYGALNNIESVKESTEYATVGARGVLSFISAGFEVQKFDKLYSYHLFLNKEINRFITLSGGYISGRKDRSWSVGLKLSLNAFNLVFSYLPHTYLADYKSIQFGVEL